MSLKSIDKQRKVARLVACVALGLVLAFMTLSGTNAQAKNPAPANQADLTEQIKFLKSAINDNVFETGTKDSSGKYEIYRYAGLDFNKCSLRWREDHEVYEARRRSLRERLDITVPLSLVGSNSVQTDHFENGGNLVSIVTRGLRPVILTKERTVYEHENEIVSIGERTGSAFYFSDDGVARKVASTLIALVRSCNSKR